MEIEKYNYRGNVTIGFHATVTSNAIIKAPDFRDTDEFEVENTVETFIAKTRLTGLFTVGNKNNILVPNNLTDIEKGKLEDSGINYETLETTETALKNLILCNDHGAIISSKLEEQKEEIKNALDVPVKVMEIAGIDNPGSCGVTNNKGAVLHRATTEETAEKVKEILQLEKVNIGTINMGSPFMGSGAVANDNYMLVGEETTGPEIGRLDNAMKGNK